MSAKRELNGFKVAFLSAFFHVNHVPCRHVAVIVVFYCGSPYSASEPHHS